MDLKVFCCQIVKHKKKEIHWLCLNEKCKSRALCCSQCLTMNHKNHPEDFHKIEKILEFIQNVDLSKAINDLNARNSQQIKKEKKTIIQNLIQELGQLESQQTEYKKNSDQLVLQQMGKLLKKKSKLVGLLTSLKMKNNQTTTFLLQQLEQLYQVEEKGDLLYSPDSLQKKIKCQDTRKQSEDIKFNDNSENGVSIFGNNQEHDNFFNSQVDQFFNIDQIFPVEQIYSNRAFGLILNTDSYNNQFPEE